MSQDQYVNIQHEVNLNASTVVVPQRSYAVSYTDTKVGRSVMTITSL